MDEEQIRAMRAIHPDMDPDKAYGGIDKLWVKPKDHRHNKIYQKHDQGYDFARAGFLSGATSDCIDLPMLKDMNEDDEERYWEELKTTDNVVGRLLCELNYARRIAENYMDYSAAHIWGLWKWPTIATA